MSNREMRGEQLFKRNGGGARLCELRQTVVSGVATWAVFLFRAYLLTRTNLCVNALAAAHAL